MESNSTNEMICTLFDSKMTSSYFRYFVLVSMLVIGEATDEVVVAQWCNPLTWKTEQLDGVGSSPGRIPPLERHDKRLRTRLGQ